MHVSRARSAAAVVAALGLALPLGGCAVGEAHRSPDEALASVQDAGDQAASAVATVRAAVVLLGRERLSVTAADTAQADSVRVLEEATRTLTTLAPPDTGTAAARDSVLAAVQGATTTVVAAGAWITASGEQAGADRGTVPDPLVADLDEAHDAVDVAVTASAGITG